MIRVSRATWRVGVASRIAGSAAFSEKKCQRRSARAPDELLIGCRSPHFLHEISPASKPRACTRRRGRAIPRARTVRNAASYIRGVSEASQGSGCRGNQQCLSISRGRELTLTQSEVTLSFTKGPRAGPFEIVGDSRDIAPNRQQLHWPATEC